MEIDFTEDDLKEAIEIVSEVYSSIMMRHHLLTKGVDAGLDREEVDDMLFGCGKVLLKLNRAGHGLKLCDCTDDSKHELMERMFAETFKKQIVTERWWKEQVLERRQSFLTSPPSPISDRSNTEGPPKLLPAPNKQPESSEGQ